MEKISVIIPAFGITPDTYMVEKELQGLDYEIIVEYDTYPGGAKGLTLQNGFKKAKGDRIVWLDGDMQIHPRHIRKFLDLNADVVIGSKHHPLAKLNYTLMRRIISLVSSLVCRGLFNLPLRDTQTGLKVFDRKVLEREWRVRGFGHDIEVLVHAYYSGYTITEMPVEITANPDSTVNLKACIKTLYEMLWVKYQLLFPARDTPNT